MVVSDPLRPNATVTNEWLYGDHTDVDEEVTQPSTPDGYPDDWSCDPDDHGEIIVMGFPDTIDDVGIITNITVWTYGETMEEDYPAISIYMGGDWEDDQNCNLPGYTLGGWTSDSFDGSWNQTDMNGLQVRYTANTDTKYGSHSLWCVYVIVTYTIPSGWPHKVLGMSPTKFNGMEITDSSKILGVG